MVQAPEAPLVLREMTIEEWADLDEDEPGELVDGRLEEEEMPTFLHETVVSWLLRALGAWVAARGGFAFGSEAKYAVGAKRGRKPDVTVYFAGRPLPARGASVARTPPSIAAEVISTRPRDARRDRIDKLADYRAFGVDQYWLIEPRLRVIEIIAYEGATRQPTIKLTVSTGKHEIPGCNGLVLDFDDLWAEVDRLPDDGSEGD